MAARAIICALITLNHCLSNTHNIEEIIYNSYTLITVHMPKENRTPERFQQFSPNDVQSNIIENDVNYEPLNEDFSVYDLSNETVISLKTVMGQISKSKFCTIDGEPIHAVTTYPILKIKRN